jgi:hypothetical protein
MLFYLSAHVFILSLEDTVLRYRSEREASPDSLLILWQCPPGHHIDSLRILIEFDADILLLLAYEVSGKKSQHQQKTRHLQIIASHDDCPFFLLPIISFLISYSTRYSIA